MRDRRFPCHRGACQILASAKTALESLIYCCSHPVALFPPTQRKSENERKAETFEREVTGECDDPLEPWLRCVVARRTEAMTSHVAPRETLRENNVTSMRYPFV